MNLSLIYIIGVLGYIFFTALAVSLLLSLLGLGILFGFYRLRGRENKVIT